VCDFGVYPGAIEDAQAALGAGASPTEAVDLAFRRPRGDPDGLALTLVATRDRRGFAEAFAAETDLPFPDVARATDTIITAALGQGLFLTGAEAAAYVLGLAGVEIAFAYPGTSELALADALLRMPGMQLINGRGDKESAFMAAGASLTTPCRGISVLHGARGLTNAAGAIADTRRNEIGTVACVGLPSTGAARFQPPHGEDALITAMSAFAKHAVEIVDPPDQADPDWFIQQLRESLADACQRPHGPVLVGIPQDIAEASWVPIECLDTVFVPQGSGTALPTTTAMSRALTAATQALNQYQRVVILVDDYLLRYDDASSALAEFSSRLGAPVLQLRYRRGPMLFDRLRHEDVPNFVGWLDPDDKDHEALLQDADLLITLEDRNIYERVSGKLPRCAKLALTSDAAKTRKNGYLTETDVLVEGDVVELLRGLSARVVGHLHHGQLPERVEVQATATLTVESARLREAITDAFAQAFRDVVSPALVDDGQMFGGLLADCYDRLPPSLRVFGDHGGFVGAGIGYSTGLALADTRLSVFCTLGDSAFANGLQGLVAAAQEAAPVTFVVCNNGGSVSLLKQALAARSRWFDDGRVDFLQNAPTLDPATVARALGVPATRISFDLGGLQAIDRAANLLRNALEPPQVRGPRLIQLDLPPLGDAWAGIWITDGFDERHAVEEHGSVSR
jgi:acetolactate synthase-1/2/3 large subunit